MPALFDFPLTESGLSRRHHVDTHVRPPGIVEVNLDNEVFAQGFDTVVYEPFEEFVLDGIVDALRLGIVLRITALRHAYPDAVCLQQVGILEACVLAAAVRMMYQVRLLRAVKSFQGHFERVDRVTGRQRVAQAPADNLLRVRVKDDRQIGEDVSVFADPDRDVRDVTNP